MSATPASDSVRPASGSAGGKADEPHNIIDTLQSLIVAFVIAMTFRAYVAEGFVIPTGSMAPTLLGRHHSMIANDTGWRYVIGPSLENKIVGDQLRDPLLGHQPGTEGSGKPAGMSRSTQRSGDRVLVHKTAYAFIDPSRWDVVVFKNPTDPNGPSGNYIKRLIGLPNESIWLVDGDVFVNDRDSADDLYGYTVQRKPEFVQRAVWQPVFRSVHLPESVGASPRRNSFIGDQWAFENGRYRYEGTGQGQLEWNKGAQVFVDDWAPYNQMGNSIPAGPESIGDLRVAATVVAESADAMVRLEVVARDAQFHYEFGPQGVRVRMRQAAFGDPDDLATADLGWEETPWESATALAPGRPVRIECWQVDQQMWLFVNDKKIATLKYDWDPVQRLEQRSGRAAADDPASLIYASPGKSTTIRFMTDGGPVALDRVEVDRDLHYRTPAGGVRWTDNPLPAGLEPINPSFGFGTHPDVPAVLQDDHFYMLGDNTLASADSRVWGYPHPIVARQIDPAPFVVPRSMLLGKAWVVYFPALHSVKDGGRGLIPNFGDLRFIR
ncbi:MAG: signal peptidase I [Phycisphaerales bacterium]